MGMGIRQGQQPSSAPKPERHSRRWLGWLAGAASVLALLSACDQQRIDALEEGLATEADVRAQFGEPATIWPERDGSRTLEYNRQPQGHKNYMITIGTDGKMSALRQVLAPQVFAQLQTGMSQEQVRRLLGQPARRMDFERQGETVWDWNWIDPPSREMELSVTFGADGRLLRWGSVEKMPKGR